MSLLLDALKEADTHRKNASQDVVEKIELPERELELELNLDDRDEHTVNVNNNTQEPSRDLLGDDDAKTDVQLGIESPFRDESKERNEHSKVKSASRESEKNNNYVLQNEKNANAVFRNRTGYKLKRSKCVISAGMLLLLVIVVAGYFYLTLTSIDLVNQHASIATRNSGAEMQMPMDEMKTDSVVTNPTSAVSLHRENEVAVMTLEDDKQELDVLYKRQPEKSSDVNVGVVSQKNNQVSGYQSDASQQEKLAATNNVHKSGEGITIRKRHMPNTTRKNLRLAQKAMVVGDWHKAERNFRNVLVDSPGNVEALIGLADAMVVLGKEDVAQSLYLNVLEKNPVNVRASVGLLNLKADKTSVNHGSELKQLITDNPDQAYLYANLGDYYARRGEWAEAQNAYFEAFSFNGMNADYAFNLAVSLDQIGKGSIAIRYYKQALELKQSSAGRFDENSLVIRIRELSGGGQ